MQINSANLQTLYTGFKANFQDGLGQAPNDHLLFTEEVPSTTSEEEYGWLGELPGMRKWAGDRVIANLKDYGYKIKNEPFESTVRVPRTAIEDDKYGIYSTNMRALGRAAGAHPCQLAYAALLGGFTAPCYDGQFFFDVDHPVLDANGSVQSVSNYQAGASEPWFLMCTTGITKPVLHQKRKDPEFVALDDPTSPNVFHKNEFIYGVDSRGNTGYGFWQYVFASQAPLNPTNYAAARAALMMMRGDYGRPLGITPDTLLVGGRNESAGRKLLVNDVSAGGETNEWKGSAKLAVTPWLTA